MKKHQKDKAIIIRGTHIGRPKRWWREYAPIVKQVPLTDHENELLTILEESTSWLWSKAPESKKREVRDLILAEVVLFKRGLVSAQNLFHRTENDIKAITGRQKKRILSPIEIQEIKKRHSVSKSEVAILFGMSPRNVRTVERYTSRGYHGIKLLRRGENKRYLIQDVLDFVKRTGKYLYLLGDEDTESSPRFGKSKSTTAKK